MTFTGTIAYIGVVLLIGALLMNVWFYTGRGF